MVYFGLPVDFEDWVKLLNDQIGRNFALFQVSFRPPAACLCARKAIYFVASDTAHKIGLRVTRC